MLDHELRQACLLETLPILRNGQWLVADLSAQHLGDGRCNSGLIQLSRSAEGICLPDMSGRLRQDGRDNPRLVLPSNWSMAPVAIRQIDDAIFDNGRAHKREQKPFREECRTDVDGRNARPVEKALVVARAQKSATCLQRL